MTATFKLVLLAWGTATTPPGRQELATGPYSDVEQAAIAAIEAAVARGRDVEELLMQSSWAIPEEGFLYIEKPDSEHLIVWNDEIEDSPMETGFPAGRRVSFDEVAQQGHLGDEDDSDRLGRVILEDRDGKLWCVEYDSAEGDGPHVDIQLSEATLGEHDLLGFRCGVCSETLVFDYGFEKETPEEITDDLRHHLESHHPHAADIEGVREHYERID